MALLLAISMAFAPSLKDTLPSDAKLLRGEWKVTSESFIDGMKTMWLEAARAPGYSYTFEGEKMVRGTRPC